MNETINNIVKRIDLQIDNRSTLSSHCLTAVILTSIRFNSLRYTRRFACLECFLSLWYRLRNAVLTHFVYR